MRAISPQLFGESLLKAGCGIFDHPQNVSGRAFYIHSLLVQLDMNLAFFSEGTDGREYPYVDGASTGCSFHNPAPCVCRHSSPSLHIIAFKRMSSSPELLFFVLKAFH